MTGFLDGLLRRKRLVALFLAVGITLGVLWAVLGQPMYEARVVAVPVKADEMTSGLLGDAFGLANLAGLASSGRTSLKQESMAVLQSRRFLRSFIEENDLLVELVGDGEVPAWRKSFSAAPSMSDGVDVLRNQVLQVTDDRRSGLVVVSVRWKDRHLATTWANELVSRLNSEMRQQAIVRANMEMEFLQSELGKTDSVDVQKAIFNLIETQLKKSMLANVSRDFALRVLDPAIVPDEDDQVSLSKKAKVAFLALLSLLFAIGYVASKEVRLTAYRQP